MVSNSPFPFSQNSFLLQSLSLCIVSLCFLTIISDYRSFSQSLLSICFVKNIFVISIPKFFNFMYFSFAVQVNTGCFSEDTVLCLVHMMHWLALDVRFAFYPLCLLLKMRAIVASTIVCAIACLLPLC